MQDTYTGEDDPEDVHGHLTPNSIGDGVQEHHAYELAQRLHGTPEGRVIGVERVLAIAIEEANMIDEALVRNDISVQGVLISIRSSGNGDQVTSKHGLSIFVSLLHSMVPSTGYP
jgi:hypothetical protein